MSNATNYQNPMFAMDMMQQETTFQKLIHDAIFNRDDDSQSYRYICIFVFSIVLKEIVRSFLWKIKELNLWIYIGKMFESLNHVHFILKNSFSISARIQRYNNKYYKRFSLKRKNDNDVIEHINGVKQKNQHISKTLTMPFTSYNWEILLNSPYLTYKKLPSLSFNRNNVGNEIKYTEQLTDINIKYTNEDLTIDAYLKGNIKCYWVWNVKKQEVTLQDVGFSANLPQLPFQETNYSFLNALNCKQFTNQCLKIIQNEVFIPLASNSSNICDVKYINIQKKSVNSDIVIYYGCSSATCYVYTTQSRINNTNHFIEDITNILSTQNLLPQDDETIIRLHQEIMFLFVCMYCPTMQHDYAVVYVFEGMFFDFDIGSQHVKLAPYINTTTNYLFQTINKMPQIELVRSILRKNLKISKKTQHGFELIKDKDKCPTELTYAYNVDFPFMVNTELKSNYEDEKYNDVDNNFWKYWNIIMESSESLMKEKNELRLKTKEKDTTVNVYAIDIIENMVEHEIDNPKYKEYKYQNAVKEEQRQKETQTEDKDSKDSKKNSSFDYIPPPKLIIYKRENQVQKEHINSVHRDFSSIYLPEDEEHELITTLYNFRNRKEFLQNIGIPNKLGIMLHGLPGTGKTSIINAIATYLEKDLFYVHLDRIKSNEDLGKVFKYVYKEHKKGGIIVLEDVDAMTNVVHKRGLKGQCENKTYNESDKKSKIKYEDFCQIDDGHQISDNYSEGNSSDSSESLDEHERSIKKQMKKLGRQKKKDNKSLKNILDIRNNKEGSLTLEYLLNILQGSLTIDDTIFVSTTNCYEKLDEAFVRDGRFDYTIKMTCCSRHQIQKIYKSFFDEDLHEDVVNSFCENKWTTSSIMMHLSKFVFCDVQKILISKKIGLSEAIHHYNKCLDLNINETLIVENDKNENLKLKQILMFEKFLQKTH
jgi:SpoVK/Ycf46/Vps4 family AAA+-type ATPase